MSWWHRNRLRLLLAGLVLLSLLLLHAGLASPARRTWLDRGLLRITAPLQNALIWVTDGVVTLWSDYLALVDVRQENRQLREKIEQLERELARMPEIEAENADLRRLAALREAAGAVEGVSARVIGYGTSPLAQSLRVNAGRSDGVVEGDAVVCGGGLVGRVVTVSAGYSVVRLIVDGSSSVDVVVQRSRVRGIVRGQGQFDECTVDYLVRTADVQVGDRLVTSGLGGVFAPGLLVGTVERITSPRTGMFRQAWLKPAVEFERLERVLVLFTMRRPGRGEAK